VRTTFAPFRDKTINNFQVFNEKQEIPAEIIKGYLTNLDDNRLRGRGLMFLGPTGVGKTLLASIVLNEAQGRGYRIEAIELSTYVGLHKDMFGLSHSLRGGNEEIEDEYIKARQHIRIIKGVSKRSTDFVLFDDVGREFQSESGWSQNEFFDTIKSRYDRGLPSLVTTNKSFEELDERYTVGLTSLLMEATEIIWVDGTDYRWKKGS
jgi:DNA replication protein DnaC